MVIQNLMILLCLLLIVFTANGQVVARGDPYSGGYTSKMWNYNYSQGINGISCPSPCSKFSPCGPYCWKNIAGGLNKCGGSSQSPINIVQAEVSNDLQYPEFQVTNGGCSFFSQFADDLSFVVRLEVRACTNLQITFKGVQYTMNHFHFQLPGEHAIGGGIADAELQMVHLSSDQKFLIISVRLLVGGGKNVFLEKLWQNAEIGAKAANYPKNVTYSYRYDVQLNGTGLNPYADILPASRNFFYYSGSLSTYPCTEDVQWLVFEEPVSIGELDLDNLRQAEQYSSHSSTLAAFNYNNNRPIQPLGSRKVYKYEVYSVLNRSITQVFPVTNKSVTVYNINNNNEDDKRNDLTYNIAIASIVVGSVACVLSLVAIIMVAVVLTKGGIGGSSNGYGESGVKA